jgi:hypothetical protein
MTQHPLTRRCPALWATCLALGLSIALGFVMLFALPLALPRHAIGAGSDGNRLPGESSDPGEPSGAPAAAYAPPSWEVISASLRDVHLCGDAGEELSDEEHRRWKGIDDRISRVTRQMRRKGDVQDGVLWLVEVMGNYTGTNYLQETAELAFDIVRSAVAQAMLGETDSVEIDIGVPVSRPFGKPRQDATSAGGDGTEPGVMLLWDLRRLRETAFDDAQSDDMASVFLCEVQQSRVLPVLGESFRREFVTPEHLQDFRPFIVKTRIGPPPRRQDSPPVF